MSKQEKKPVRVWSCDRRLRYGIVADCWDQLCSKINLKFELQEQKFSVALEEDGTIVDESYWDSLEPQRRLIILKDSEQWEAPPPPIPNLLNFDKRHSCDAVDGSDITGGLYPYHTIHMFIQLQKNPAGIALLDMENLEIIKDIDIDEILDKEGSYGLDSEFCKKIQDMSIELYVKRRTEVEAIEYIKLLKECKGIQNISEG